MGFFARLGNMFNKRSELANMPDATPIPAVPPAAPAMTPEWVMPRFEGRDICDWGSTINKLKREENYAEALRLACGCMTAMSTAAQENPQVVMEYYVIEVVKIQHKIRDYQGEIDTINSWLALDLPATRGDYRIGLRKRLAKAKELVAKAQGLDASEFTAEWRRMLELEKLEKADPLVNNGVSSGQSRAHGGRPQPKRKSPERKSPALVPAPERLHALNFVAVDFETANRASGASACQIALVKVVGGVVVDKLETLLKPPAGWDDFEFSHLHGIKKSHVRDAPTWAQVAPAVAQFVGELPVWAHNARFDAKVWRDLDSFFGLSTLPREFYCTYLTAKQLMPGLPNYKLPTVVGACAPSYRLHHHAASSDAEACALIVCALQRVG